MTLWSFQKSGESISELLQGDGLETYPIAGLEERGRQSVAEAGKYYEMDKDNQVIGNLCQARQLLEGEQLVRHKSGQFLSGL